MEFKCKIKREEVLRYLGYRGQVINKELEILIDICRDEILEKSKPRYIYEYFDLSQVKDGIELQETNLVLKGKDIRKHLNESKECVVIIATLGLDIERLIMLNEKINLSKSIILDACATTYIEEICDLIEDEVRKAVKERNLNITWRYSPGYGDLSLSHQKEILKVMNATKRLGVTTTEHNVLFPRKSVTAIIGINKNITEKKEACINCNKFESCIYRKGGKCHGD